MHKGGRISITKVSTLGSVIEFEVNYEGEVSKFFNENTSFNLDYFEDVSKTPQSIAIIPLVVNLLPIVWVYDTELLIPDIDEDFYNNLKSIKSGYENMYPSIDFKGSVKSNKISKNLQPQSLKSEQTLLMFSGGVDATSSLVSMLKSQDRPRLFTIWGADVKLADKKGWNEKKSHTENVGNVFNLESSFVKSSFRTFLHEPLLDNLVADRAGDMWWHGFQHGIGLIGHSAPIVYKYKISRVHIAASFTKDDDVTCASNPTIDEHLYIGSSRVTHDGYNFSRQDKVGNICSYVDSVKEEKELASLPIKVCWISEGAKNCGRCEKCIRTACEIIVEGGSLDFYGIDNFDNRFAKKLVIEEHVFYHVVHWKNIQTRLVQNSSLRLKPDEDISWVLEINFDEVNNHPKKKIKMAVSAIRKAAVGLIPSDVRPVVKRLTARK